MNGGWSPIRSLTFTTHPVAQLLGDSVNYAIRDISESIETDHLSLQSWDTNDIMHV